VSTATSSCSPQRLLWRLLYFRYPQYCSLDALASPLISSLHPGTPKPQAALRHRCVLFCRLIGPLRRRGWRESPPSANVHVSAESILAWIQPHEFQPHELPARADG